jgi:hypothetical protein
MLDSIFSYYSASFAFRRSNFRAWRLLATSIVDLPAVFILMTVGKK